MVRSHVVQRRADFPSETRSSFIESWRDDCSELFQKLGDIHAIQGLFAIFLEILRGKLQDALNHSAKRPEVRTVLDAGKVAQVLIKHRRSSCQITNFIRDGACNDSRTAEKLPKAGLFAIAQLFGHVRN